MMTSELEKIIRTAIEACPDAVILRKTTENYDLYNLSDHKSIKVKEVKLYVAPKEGVYTNEQMKLLVDRVLPTEVEQTYRKDQSLEGIKEESICNLAFVSYTETKEEVHMTYIETAITSKTIKKWNEEPNKPTSHKKEQKRETKYNVESRITLEFLPSKYSIITHETRDGYNPVELSVLVRSN